MLEYWNRPSVRIGSAIVIAAITVTVVEAGGPFRNPLRQRTSVEHLAEKIDKLEKHIDAYGSVVAKTPDVWGEARLTKYRRNVETVLSEELTKFAPTISATISRSDQAFLTSSLALQAALGGSQAVMVNPAPQFETTTTQFVASNPDGTPMIGPDGKPVILKKDTPTKVADETITGQTIPTLTADPAGLKGTIVARSETLKMSSSAAFANGGAVGLEPTLKLDQLQRYLDHLNQLRRNNDGDDMSDSPGYAMHLVRIPVSVLPGSLTKEGYGAEINVIAKPHLHEKLLQETFRGLVINDVIDQLALPMAKFIDRPDVDTIIPNMQIHSYLMAELEKLKTKPNDLLKMASQFEIARKNAPNAVKNAENELAAARKPLEEKEKHLEKINRDILGMVAKDLSPEVKTKVSNELYQSALRTNAATPQLEDALSQTLADLNITQLDESNLAALKKKSATKTKTPKEEWEETVKAVVDSKEKVKPLERAVDDAKANLKQVASGVFRFDEDDFTLETAPTGAVLLQERFNNVQSAIKEIEEALSGAGALPAVATSPSRRAQLPFAPEQLDCVYGYEWLGDIAKLVQKLKQDGHNKQAALLVDVRRVLADNLHNAYGMLNHRLELWQHCTHELAVAIRQNDCETVKLLRDQFFNSMPPEWREPVKNSKDPVKRNPVIAVAWTIIVESALLNERLIEDMKLMQTAKNCFCLTTDWMPFFHPEPPSEVVAAFNQYVECRWPVHVFALDPMTDDQNVVDAFSQRREMQLAMSLAFATGKINAQKFMRYARTLDLDMQSIALNRTSVGFSHGDDTFGWRFHPRVQSPPSRGNFTVATRELLIGGFTQDQQLATRRLEAGMRECTAIVLLPAFVPYAIFDFRTNWFKLTNPTKKEFDLEDGVEISEDIQSLRQLSQTCVKDAHKYRQSEVYMLTRAVDQLERRLPLQTTYVQIPFENGLGGFEFFNGGAPDLAPELHGFYGEPGIHATKESTIFLVGENFSVHETEVVVGNRRLDPQKEIQLLSRQVMRISVTGPVNALDKKVEIHIATPYGVSNHLEVPLIASADEAAAKALAEHEEKRHVDRFAWKDTPNPTVIVQLKANGDIDTVELPAVDQGIGLQIVSKSVPDPRLTGLFGEAPTKLAAWMIVTSTDSKKEAQKIPVGPWDVPADGKIKLSALIPSATTSNKFLDAMKKLPYDFQPSEIELIGFVRSEIIQTRAELISTPAVTQPLPTLRLENSFKLKVALVKAKP